MSELFLGSLIFWDWPSPVVLIKGFAFFKGSARNSDVFSHKAGGTITLDQKCPKSSHVNYELISNILVAPTINKGGSSERDLQLNSSIHHSWGEIGDKGANDLDSDHRLQREDIWISSQFSEGVTLKVKELIRFAFLLQKSIFYSVTDICVPWGLISVFALIQNNHLGTTRQLMIVLPSLMHSYLQ